MDVDARGSGVSSLPFPGAVVTEYWHVTPDGRVQCDVCPRFCKLHEGQRGFCFVRARQGGQIVLTTYGLSSGFCVDPIEKKPLSHFLPGTPVLSFGTAGCNLGCRFCQNWDISKSRETATLAAEASPQAIVKAALATGSRSVAFTYNDPTVFHEYALDVSRACREAGLKTVSVTAGYVCPEPRAELYREIDAANVDLKAFTESFYEKVTGSHLKNVLETLVYLKHETNVWLEITTLLIPGQNDSEKEIQELTQWIAANLGCDVPLHFTAFHPDWKMLDLERTPLATLKRARAIGRANGLRYVYTGNVDDETGASTTCSGCGTIVIRRRGYEILAFLLDRKGRCLRCGTACPGVFEANPGTWGSRRQPVVITSSV